MKDENVSEVLPKTIKEVCQIQSQIPRMLMDIPELWTEWDPDKLTDIQERTLFLLVAAGLVERRCRLRMQMLNHPRTVEAFLTFTGESGVSSLEQVAALMWQEWEDAWKKWKETETAETSPFHSERMKPEEWRLTAQGVLAQSDLREGRLALVFDFVLKREFFRDRLPVKGTSELLRIDREEESGTAEPQTDTASETAASGVKVDNWHEGADAIANAFGPMINRFFEAMAEQKGNGALSPNGDQPATSAAPMLFGWNEILEAVHRPNERAEQERVKRLNAQFDGPIVIPKGKGTQPTVRKDALVAWWNRLAELHLQNQEDAQARGQEERLNVGKSAQHDYGKSGTVAAEIDGSVRRKRTRKKTNGDD